MELENISEKKIWDNTASLLGEYTTTLGEHWSFNFRNDPKRLGFVLSRYKFAAKMACNHANVLELGCSDAIGATILAENAKSYTGVDLDQAAIDSARMNLPSNKFSFHYADFMGRCFGSFDAIISLDVIEHILPEFEDLYFSTLTMNLAPSGICVIGTPNITSSEYASENSKIGHVNLYSQKRLLSMLQRYFWHVLPFGMNDEIVHTGFAEMSHYLCCVCCHKKENI